MSATRHSQGKWWIRESSSGYVVEDEFVSRFCIMNPIPVHSNQWIFTCPSKLFSTIHYPYSSTWHLRVKVVFSSSMPTTCHNRLLKSCKFIKLKSPHLFYSLHIFFLKNGMSLFFIRLVHTVVLCVADQRVLGREHIYICDPNTRKILSKLIHGIF